MLRSIGSSGLGEGDTEYYCLRTKRQNNMARVEHLDDSFGTESTEVESDKRDSLEDGGSSVKMDTYRVREETGR